MHDGVLDTPAGAVHLLEALAPAGARGAVIVLHEAVGLNDHLRDIVSRVAAAGYDAVAPNLYHRTRATPIPYGDHDAVYRALGAMGDDEVEVDLAAVLAHLEARGWRPDQIGVIGFNIGGRLTFLAASRWSLGAAIGFYGAGIVTPHPDLAEGLPSLVDRAPDLRTPWLGIFGDEDHTVALADVDLLASTLAAGSAVRVHTGAGHAFYCDARPALYRPEAARQAWADTLDWLDGHLAAR